MLKVKVSAGKSSSVAAMVATGSPFCEPRPLTFSGIAAGPGVEIWGPVPAPMARRAGRHRAHLLFQSTRRDILHALLDGLPGYAAGLPNVRRVRWSLDIDPIDLY